MRQAPEVQDRSEEHEGPSVREADGDFVGQREDGSAGTASGGGTTSGSSGSATGTTSTSTSSTGSATAIQGDGCMVGQTIPQGTYAADGDEDNTGGADDGDGCY